MYKISLSGPRRANYFGKIAENLSAVPEVTCGEKPPENGRGPIKKLRT
jgi:hypothetical protein